MVLNGPRLNWYPPSFNSACWILPSLASIQYAYWSLAFDLIVTLPTWGTKDIVERVETHYPEALFYKCVNRGRDIGPFIDLLPIILNKKYDLALKLHTKNGYFQAGEFISDYSQLWRDESLTALLGSEKRVNTIISAFKVKKNNPVLAVVFYYISCTT